MVWRQVVRRWIDEESLEPAVSELPAVVVHVHPTPMGPSGPPLPAFTGGRLDQSVLSEVTYTR
jgi:hypothetical protein